MGIRPGRALILPLAAVLCAAALLLVITSNGGGTAHGASTPIVDRPTDIPGLSEPPGESPQSSDGVTPSTPPNRQTSPVSPKCPEEVLDAANEASRHVLGLQYRDAEGYLLGLGGTGRTVLFVGASGLALEEPETPSGVSDALIVIARSSVEVDCEPIVDDHTQVVSVFTLTLGAAMPQVVGMTRSAAMAALGARGLDRHVTWIPPAAEPSRSVLGQQPPASSLVAFSDPVVLDFEHPLQPPPAEGGGTKPAGHSGLPSWAGPAGIGLLLLLLLVTLAALAVRRRTLRPEWVRQHVRVALESGADWSSEPAESPESRARPEGRSIRLDLHHDAGTSTITEGER